MHRKLPTIVYTRSRKLTELIALWAVNQSGDFANRISAYRAGFLAEERRDIDKAAAIFILNRLKQMSAANPVQATWIIKPPKPIVPTGKKPSEALYYGVFDLETQRSAAEVGGWQRAELMKISCAVLYDSREDRFIDFVETQIPRFVECLKTYDLVVGFNIKSFDYQVLKGYSDFNFMKLNNLDILEEVKNYLGFRLSLSHLAAVTLGADKTADGLQALQWWKQGRILEIIEYCRQDVKITKDLYLYTHRINWLRSVITRSALRFLQRGSPDLGRSDLLSPANRAV